MFEGAGRWPGLLTQVCRLMRASADPGRFCPRGYAVVNVDIRGSNNSDGKIHIMGEQMRQDGCDVGDLKCALYRDRCLQRVQVIEALAKMDWCNGNIGEEFSSQHYS